MKQQKQQTQIKPLPKATLKAVSGGYAGAVPI